MNLLSLLLLSLFILPLAIFSQDNGDDLPFRQIPDYPESYTPGTVAARMVDALGYRYYWATEGLEEKDLTYRPSEDARSVGETLDHILGLAQMISHAVQQKPNVRPAPKVDRDWQETRSLTLELLQSASDLLKSSSDSSVVEFQVIFQRGGEALRISLLERIKWAFGRCPLPRRASSLLSALNWESRSSWHERFPGKNARIMTLPWAKEFSWGMLGLSSNWRFHFCRLF